MGDGKWTLTRTDAFTVEGEKGRDIHKNETSWEYADFGEARDAFRRLVRECAMTEGNVFDGDGSIRNLQKYLGFAARRIEEEKRNPTPNGMLGSKILRGAPDVAITAGDFESAKAMPAALRSWLLDMDAYDANPLPEFKWTDWCFGIVSKPDAIAMGAIRDGDRIEYYDAQVYTNAFDMSDSDGDYEFSVRTMFDVYDLDAGSLRIRLVKGAAASGGHFVWPEERDDWPAILDEPAPCIEGEFDGNGSITVRVRPGREGEEVLDDRLVDGYEGFVDDVIAIADGKRGVIVDVAERRRDPEGEWGSARLRCYRVDEEECWSKLRIGIHYDLHPPDTANLPEHIRKKMRRRDEPPISVSCLFGRRSRESFEDYPGARAEVERLLDEYIANVGKLRDPDEKKPKVIMIDVVLNLGDEGSR